MFSSIVIFFFCKTDKFKKSKLSHLNFKYEENLDHSSGWSKRQCWLDTKCEWGIGRMQLWRNAAQSILQHFYSFLTTVQLIGKVIIQKHQHIHCLVVSFNTAFKRAVIADLVFFCNEVNRFFQYSFLR